MAKRTFQTWPSFEAFAADVSRLALSTRVPLETLRPHGCNGRARSTPRYGEQTYSGIGADLQRDRRWFPAPRSRHTP